MKLLQEQTPYGEATQVFATVRDQLREADDDLKAAEDRARQGGDAPSGALAVSIAAVRLQVTDLLEYVDLLEWASTVSAVATDLRRAIPTLATPDHAAGTAVFEQGAARLASIAPPAEAEALHRTLSDAVGEAAASLRDATDDAAIGRLRQTFDDATDAAPLRTRLALEQFSPCESLLG